MKYSVRQAVAVAIERAAKLVDRVDVERPRVPVDLGPEPTGPDADFAQPPMLYTAMVNGQPKRLMAAGTKDAEVFIIDPDAASENDRVVWSGFVGPGSHIGGMEFGAATDGTRL